MLSEVRIGVVRGGGAENRWQGLNDTPTLPMSQGNP